MCDFKYTIIIDVNVNLGRHPSPGDVAPEGKRRGLAETSTLSQYAQYHQTIPKKWISCECSVDIYIDI